MNTGLQKAGPPGTVLSQELFDFIQSGVSIVVGVVGTDGRARPGRALGTRVVDGGVIRLIYPDEGNFEITAAARSGGPIAVTFSAPFSHRTIQVKAASCRAEELDPEDQTSADRQGNAFAGVLSAIGYAPAFVNAFCSYRAGSLSVLSFRADAAFEQTPGPGAGRSI